MESALSRSDHSKEPERATVRADRIALPGPVFAAMVCGASSAIWLWFTSPDHNYLLNVAVSLSVLFFGALGHLVVQELRATAAVHGRRRYVPLRRSRYYAFSAFFVGVAMISILLHVPVHARFALSRAAMNAFVTDVQEDPGALRPATMRVGSYVLEASPHLRGNGALMFRLADDGNAGFTYSTTPIVEYPGENPGVGGKLGGGWYWFHDE